MDSLDGLDDHTMQQLPVPVRLPPGQRRRNTAGIEYWQSTQRIAGEIVNGVPITSLLPTAYDLALRATNLTEAVVALDALLATRLLKLAQVEDRISEVSGRRNCSQARSAISRARTGVRSSWESRLRMFAELTLGIGGMQTNAAVFDRAGRLLGVPDLLHAEAALALEYDGASWKSTRAMGHRDRLQHREDNVREERLERAGLIVVRADKLDLTRYRDGLATRIRAAYADGLCRDRTKDRWTLNQPPGWIDFLA